MSRVSILSLIDSLRPCNVPRCRPCARSRSAVSAADSAESPCTALAPISGVLHPDNFTNGNMQRANGRRIYLVHGALDWMFPIDLARTAADELRRCGADLVFREVEDLSHTYPRGENPRILTWFDPGLALESAASAQPGSRGPLPGPEPPGKMRRHTSEVLE